MESFCDLKLRKNDHLMIFVTGIPSKASPAVVLEHFQVFGNFQIHRLGNSKKGSSSLNLNPVANSRRGFCVLKALDYESYVKVLNSSDKLFHGRSLRISHFRYGPELASHKEFMNARRVIIKKVPNGTCSELLQTYLENTFGPITRMYRYEAESLEKALKKEKRRKSNSYSVEFVEISSAIKATSLNCFYLPGCTTSIIVEKYHRTTNISFIQLKQKTSNQSSRLLDFQNKLVPQVKHSAELTNLFTSDSKGGFPCSGEIHHLKTISNTVGVGYHFLKPTDRIYHSRRVETAQSLNSSKIAGQILRFNILKPRTVPTNLINNLLFTMISQRQSQNRQASNQKQEFTTPVMNPDTRFH